MHMLIFAITCSVAVSILLKLTRNHDIRIAQSIAINYAVASALTLFLLEPDMQVLTKPSLHWALLLLLGGLLPSIFFIMAKAVASAGIALSDAAQRLSLLIPLLAAFLLFDEPVDPQKLLGIALALLALLCLLYKPSGMRKQTDKHSVWLLLGVWTGYGVIDVSFKQLAKTGADFSASLLASFILAGLLSLTGLALSKTRWHARSLLVGLLLGVLNFGNIYAYIRAHQNFPDSPALIFASMNIGVISLGVIMGLVFFKEALLRINLLGIALALAAILMLAV